MIYEKNTFNNCKYNSFTVVFSFNDRIEDWRQILGKSGRFEIKDHKDEVLESGSIGPNAKEEIKEAARKHNPKKDKTLSERIKDKKEQSQKKQKDKNRQREKTKKKSWDTSL